MTASDFRFGFRIVGKTCEPRRLVDAGAAFAAYAACDQRAECGREAYLSAFQFAADFRQHLELTSSTAGFAGPCWSPWLWFDIDAEELGYAHKDAGSLAAFLVERYAIAPGELLIFFSGSKGFHLGLPTCLWSPSPSPDFARTARRFAEHAAELAVVTIDVGVYDRVRAFRAPNSRHPKTGLHKRRLTFDALVEPLDAILELAKAPAPFEVPTPTAASETAIADWQSAVALVARDGEARAARRTTGNGTSTLNRSTLHFIRAGASTGDRHRLLFSAAANLAEFGCPPPLAVALLEEPALDSGLPPREVRRQIECGLRTVAGPSAPLPRETTQQESPGSPQDALDISSAQEARERSTEDSVRSEGQSCQQVARLPAKTPSADLQAALTRLWASMPGPKADQVSATAPVLVLGSPTSPDSPTLIPLPPDAIDSGRLDKPCKCGSTEYAEVPISEGRTRRDCRKCGRFVGWGKWYDQGGPAR